MAILGALSNGMTEEEAKSWGILGSCDLWDDCLAALTAVTKYDQAKGCRMDSFRQLSLGVF